MSALSAALTELEDRLRLILPANGYQTSLGAKVLPAGTYLEESDAPCVALFEAPPNDEGVMQMDVGTVNACGVEFTVNYLVQAFVTRDETITPLAAADKAAADIMRALFGPSRGAMTTASGHKLVRRGRGLTPKGGNVIPVLIGGRFTVTEQVFA